MREREQDLVQQEIEQRMGQEDDFSDKFERVVDSNYDEYSPYARLTLPVDRIPDDI